MHKYPVRFFLFLNAACLSVSCNQYRHMQKVQGNASCVFKFKPDFRHVIYKTSVDVVGKHLSGLLVFKYMPDSSTRVVFTSETGLGFFDFGFLPGNRFIVYQVISKMDKKAVIKTLRNDFDLILFNNTSIQNAYELKDSSLVYHAFPQKKGVNYYITDEECSQLIKLQRASNKKPIMEAVMNGYTPGNSPEHIQIRHLNFNFSVSLQKLTPIASQ
jgi:hypothetical protein